jgi:glycosyltransferase involved in cell wall biosynthesis
MRVVVITETFPPNMGYLVTMLPKYLTRLGVDVHVLAIDLPSYHNLGEFSRGVPKFLQSQVLQAGSVSMMDGYTVHVQKHRWLFGYTFMTGLHGKLREIKPDVVYCVMAIGWAPLLTLVSKMILHFKLFTGSHTSVMMFPLASSSTIDVSDYLRNACTRWLPGRLVSLFTEKCYCPTSDCGVVAWRFFGIQRRKVKIIHLGVDTDYFFPIASEADRVLRQEMRARLGFSEAEIVCIYTGKMTEQKNPVLLARAIDRLRAEGLAYRGLFIGDGAQRAAVETFSNSVVLDLMPFQELGPYYRAADIAVWLTNESTSMLDAAACGLPIIVSDRIYQDHVTGNGLAYRMNNIDSLCEKLRELGELDRRCALGENAAKKMHDGFTWDQAAKKRLQDFRLATGIGERLTTGVAGSKET